MKKASMNRRRFGTLFGVGALAAPFGSRSFGANLASVTAVTPTDIATAPVITQTVAGTLISEPRAGDWGYRFQIPGPDASLRLSSATIRFPWQYWTWQGAVYNSTSVRQRFNGFMPWSWWLTGHPGIFPNAPSLMGSNGIFQFYDTAYPHRETAFGPNAWLVEPMAKTFRAGFDLPQLLGIQRNGILEAWIGGILNGWVTGPGVSLGAWSAGGGPNQLWIDYVYQPILNGDPRMLAP